MGVCGCDGEWSAERGASPTLVPRRKLSGGLLTPHLTAHRSQRVWADSSAALTAPSPLQPRCPASRSAVSSLAVIVSFIDLLA